MVLPTDTLITIMEKCYEKFPKLTRIGAYATPADLIRKTPEELKRLREAGLAIVYMGIESGDDDVLTYVDKGTTADLTIEAGKKALAAGMKLSTMILLGLGGQERTKEHALHTAKVVSAINPTMLSALSSSFPMKSPSTTMSSAYIHAPYGPGIPQRIGHDPASYGNDQSLYLPQQSRIEPLPRRGTLPMDKDKMLAALEQYIPRADDTRPLLNDNGNF